MEILGIGPLELLLIVLIVLIILGPKEMEKTARTIGRSLNKLVKSNIWRDIRVTSEKVRNLPTELMRQAELEELQKTLQTPITDEPRILPKPAARPAPMPMAGPATAATPPDGLVPGTIPPESPATEPAEATPKPDAHA
jgi:sec-independent protein translocase protein TatB